MPREVLGLVFSVIAFLIILTFMLLQLFQQDRQIEDLQMKIIYLQIKMEGFENRIKNLSTSIKNSQGKSKETDYE